MSYQQRVYDDFDNTGQMVLDCAACGERVDLPRRSRELSAPPQAMPWTKTKDDVELAAAAAHLAARLHLA